MKTTEMLKIKTEEKSEVVIIGISGELYLNSIVEFEQAFKKYCNSEFKTIALDLKKMHFLDSFGISRIIKVSRSFVNTGTEFVLINMNDNIHQIFRMATLDRFFTILSGEEFAEVYLSEESSIYQSNHVEMDREISSINLSNTTKIG